MAIEMNWNYIAGFFDGEGTITGQGHTSVAPRVVFYQTQKRGRALLTHIQRFMEDEDQIRSYLAKVNPKGNRLPCYHLTIGKQDEVLCFLRHIFPYLRIKRVEAQDAIRCMRIFPSMPGSYYGNHTSPIAMERRRNKTCVQCGIAFRDTGPSATRETCNQACTAALIVVRRRLKDNYPKRSL